MNQLLIYKILYTNCNRIFVIVIILVSYDMGMVSNVSQLLDSLAELKIVLK